MKRLLLLLVLLAFGSVTMSQEVNSVGQMLTVSFCDLVSNPDRYDKKIIRTTAIYGRYCHGTFLYHSSCRNADGVNAQFESSSQFKTPSLVERQLEKVMSRGKNGSGRASVTVIGRFSNWDGIGYGHLGYARFQFDVMSFESAKSVPRSTRSETSGDFSESFMADVKEIRDVLDVRWNAAYLWNDVSELEKILPEDFTLTNEQQIVLSRSEVISLANRVGRPSADSSISAAVTSGKIFITGSTAEVTEGIAMSGNCKNVMRQYRFMNRYSKHNGHWQIISSRIVSLAPGEVPNPLPCN